MRLGRDHEGVGLGQRLQARRQVRRLADRGVLLRHAFADEIADHDHAGGDADARLQGHARSGLQRADRIEDGEPRAHRALGVVLVCGRIAEIGEHAIAQILRDHAAEALDLAGAARLEGADHLALLLRIEPRRERARADHVAEHDGELATLGGGRRRAAKRSRAGVGRACGDAPECKAGAALGTELGLRRVGVPTGRARPWQCRSALLTEIAALRHVRAAARALHRSRSLPFPFSSLTCSWVRRSGVPILQPDPCDWYKNPSAFRHFQGPRHPRRPIVRTSVDGGTSDIPRRAADRWKLTRTCPLL